MYNALQEGEMIDRIDHVSLAVRDFEAAQAFFTEILGAVRGASAGDERLKYFWQIYSLGDMSRLEIITPTGTGSFLDGFLRDRAGGVHHITLQTPDIQDAQNRLDARGIPYFGYAEYGDLWKEIFIHPKDAFGVLIQIAEFRADDWLSPSVRMQGQRKTRVERTDRGVCLEIAHPGGGTAKVSMDVDEARLLMEDLGRVLSQNG